MLLGHYGIALAAKRAAPDASLGTTFFAAQWLDELWPLLLLAGVEHVRIMPGLTAANPLEFSHYPYSHSLLAALLWGGAIGMGYFAWRRSSRRAVVFAALVVSDWFLDLPMHRPDLPLWPGSDIKVGLGIWRSRSRSSSSSRRSSPVSRSTFEPHGRATASGVGGSWASSCSSS